MFPILEIPAIVSEVFNQYRDVFCRDEGFDWVSRYVTGLLVSPNKTLQGIYDLQVFPEREQPPSRRAMHEAVFEAGWDADRLLQQHRQVIAPDYRGNGRVVVSLDWTYAHHERGPRIYGVKQRYDYVQHGMKHYQTVLTAVVSNHERFDGVETIVQAPSFEKEEKAYLKATDKAQYESLEEARQRVLELLSYEVHRRAYKKRTDMFLGIVQQFEEEGHFPDVDYVFDNGVLSRPLTTYIEERGKYWLSELEKSRNINWKGQWRRLDDVAEELRRDHPEAFRKHSALLRNGETRTCWIFSKVVRLKRYGKLRVFLVHDKEDLSDTPQYLVTNAVHWEGTKAIQTWSYRWTSEVFHEFGKQSTGFESAQVRKEEAVTRHFRLSCVAQSILQRVIPEASTSEKFAFADGHITCGQRLKAIAREVFRSVLSFVKHLFEEGKSCQHVLEVLMPA
jgi:hypothetical protein